MARSVLPGFYRLSVKERQRLLAELAGLSEEELILLSDCGAVGLELLDKTIENVVGCLPMPLAIATNFLVNGREYLIPMCIEEPSVVAAASFAAKVARKRGGFRARATEPLVRGQVVLKDVPDLEGALERLEGAKEDILGLANSTSSTLPKLGGGAKDLRTRTISVDGRVLLVAELYVDCRDAMGANIVNTMCEAIAPLLARLTSGRPLLRILSNLTTERMAFAEATFAKEEIGGERVVEDIVLANKVAAADIYRCATHNKGIMNGIIALAMALGQDTRAIEAAAHAYASMGGRYRPLTSWAKDERGDLVGRLELPLSMGTVGGFIRAHPTASLALKVLGVRSAQELAEVACSVGLAQNFAALRALVSEGIQAGHMKLHARSLALAAGAKGAQIDEIAKRMVEEGRISLSRAKELLSELLGRAQKGY
jgi:hydroxymethylglutaryl-CoA reductase